MSDDSRHPTNGVEITKEQWSLVRKLWQLDAEEAESQPSSN